MEQVMRFLFSRVSEIAAICDRGSEKELYTEVAKLHRTSLKGRSSYEIYHQNLLKVP